MPCPRGIGRFRSSRLGSLIVGLFLWAQANQLPAQDADKPPRDEPVLRFTLQECIEIALENQPAIDVKRSAVGEAAEQKNVARSFFFPQVSFQTRYTLVDEPLTVDFNNPVTGNLADVSSDGAAFFGIARAAGSSAALAALDNPNVSVAPGLPSFNAAKQAALDQLPDTFRVGLLGENSLTTDILLTQPIWTGGKIRYRHQQAGLGVQAARADVSKSRQQTVFDVTQAYLGIQLAHELHQVVRDGIGHFRAIQSLVQALIDEGDEYVTTVDLHRVATVRHLAEGELVRIENALELSHAALRRAMGVDRDADFQVAVPRLTFQQRHIELPNVLDEAMTRRPELAQTQLAVRIADLERKLAKAEYVPDVGLFGRFSAVVDDRDFANPNEQQEEQWAVGVSVGVPLFTGGRRSAQMRQAEFQQAKARQSYRLLRELITLEVQQAYLQYLEASQKLRKAEQAKENAEKTLDGYQNQFLGDQINEEDMPDYFEDLTQARLLRTRAAAEYYQTVHRYNLSLAQLQLVSGSDEYYTPIDDSGSASAGGSGRAFYTTRPGGRPTPAEGATVFQRDRGSQR